MGDTMAHPALCFPSAMQQFPSMIQTSSALAKDWSQRSRRAFKEIVKTLEQYRKEIFPLVQATELLDLESYKHPGISVGLQKKQIWYLRILLSESQAEAWLLSNSDYLMGSENLYRCFQGKLKDLLLGGMVLPVPQDRGPALHSGSNCLERWATGCRVSARLWVRTPKTTFPFSWVYSWIVWVE